MTNIEKALEAHPSPWSVLIREKRTPAIQDCNKEPVLGFLSVELIDLIVAAVNAYEQEQPCEACYGTGRIGDLPAAAGPREHNSEMLKCLNCKGTGKQPDLVEYMTKKIDELCEKLGALDEEIVKRDKAIRELVAACEICESLFSTALENVADDDWYCAKFESSLITVETALSNAKEVVG